jgi:hypothetical protein
MQISVQHEHQHWSDTLSGIFRDSKAAECANTLVARPGPTPLQSTEGVGNSFCLSFFFKRSGKNYQYSLSPYLFDINYKLILTWV